MKNQKFRSRAVAVAAVAALAVACAGSAFAAARYTRVEATYVMPDVTLVDQDGRPVRLREYLAADKAVIVDFIYATCTTICPVLSAGFVNFQRKADPAAPPVRLVSFTIDPENDSPEVLKEYLRRYNARPGWDFLTGSRKDIDQVMRAFNAYVPDKMSHQQLTFIKGPGSATWVRIEGLIGTAEMRAEYAKVTGN
jgi:protein SCO1/2